MSDFLPPLMVTLARAALCQQSAVGVFGGIERVFRVTRWRHHAGGRAAERGRRRAAAAAVVAAAAVSAAAAAARLAG